MTKQNLYVVVGACGALLLACDTNETGDLEIILEPEDTITDGVVAGDAPANIRDGWSLSYDRFVVVIGEVDLLPVRNPDAGVSDGALYAIDLATLPSSGVALWTFDGLKAGRWTPFYGVHPVTADTTRDPSVRKVDFEAMRDGGWSYLIEGRITQATGESCPPAVHATPGSALPTGNTNAAGDPCYAAPEVHFRLGVEVEVTYGPCGIDGLDGFSMPAGGSQTVAFTIHGDHLFFNGFPEGSEGGVRRQAQWLADSDLNLDGEVTRDELESLVPSDLVAMQDYNLNADIQLNDLWDYVKAQLRTQGHFQGEGECAIEGFSHD